MSSFELVLQAGDHPDSYVAWVPDGAGGKAAELGFAWRAESVALSMDLDALQKAAISGEPPEDDLHVTFGRRLYDTVFTGAVGELWQMRRPVRLVLRIDPETARSLLNLPWEYLHDGKDFLALQARTPVARLPWGLLSEPLPPLYEPLRLLVLIAAPLGLSQDMILHTAREEDLILAATTAARRSGRLQVDFAPAGSPEALEAALREIDPHLLHFTGHGVFDEMEDSGFLLMEDPDGRERRVANAEFAELLERCGRSLRLVFLSACQSAVASRTDGYADLAPRLLEAGIPAIVAMQFSVLNRTAMDFGSVFYKGLADGDPIDAALTEARSQLARDGVNRVDFAVPVLFLSDPCCLAVDEAAFQPADEPAAPLDLAGLTAAPSFVGRSAELRTLQVHLDPEHGTWRAAVVHGLGGMGKTVLAVRLAERMAPRLDGITAMRWSPTTTARDVIDQISAFLQVRQVFFQHPGVPALLAMKEQPLPLEAKAAALCDILRSLRLLIIFDNCEDVLPQGRVVSRAGEEEPESDPDLLRLIGLLLEGVPGPSRFLFTSRVDFSPFETGSLADAVGHLGLGEMQFRDAVYLMESLPPLDVLPVAVMANAPGAGPRLAALTKREVYGRLGGHPYTLSRFAEHARRSSPEEVLDDLADVRSELLDFTLLTRAAAALPERAALLLRRAAVYEEAVPREGLSFLLGDERDAMPAVEDEAEALLGWGLLARPPGTETYVMHGLVRTWARSHWTPDERLHLLRRAAGYWSSVEHAADDPMPELNARYYFYRAGDYRRADDLVQKLFDDLYRWGQIELLLRLLSESARTVEGEFRAIALGTRAQLYQDLGEYEIARRDHRAALAVFEETGSRRMIASALINLGNLEYLQGHCAEARNFFERSLAIEQEVGYKPAIARCLHQLGIVQQAEEDFESARTSYEQSLEMAVEAGERRLGAKTLHQLGVLHQLQRDYRTAGKRYEQALVIFQQLGDQAGMSGALHQLGVLYRLMGDHAAARWHYEQSLEIAEELGDVSAVASTLGELGKMLEKEGDLSRAAQIMAQVLALFEQLGSPEREFAERDLARLRERMGEEAFAKALALE